MSTCPVIYGRLNKKGSPAKMLEWLRKIILLQKIDTIAYLIKKRKERSSAVFLCRKRNLNIPTFMMKW